MQYQPGLRRHLVLSFYTLCSAAMLFGGAHGARSIVPAQRASAQAVRTAVPAEAADRVRQALKAVNTHDPNRVAPFMSGDSASFSWVAETTTKHWQADILMAPAEAADTSDPVYLAVFHAWHTCESDGDHVHRLLHVGDDWRLGAEIPETDTGGFRVRDHDLNVTFDVRAKTASVGDRARIERTTDSIPPFCLLRLSQDFRVQQMALDGVPAPYQQAGGILMFAPPRSRAFVVTLRYAGTVDHQGSDYILPTEATLNSYWYPHTARLPASATITVTPPPGWTAIAQGELMRRQRLADGALQVTYRNDLPTSFFTVDAAPYHITSRQVGGRTLSAYLIRNDPGFAATCLDRLQSALTLYESRFSRFPYSRYAVVETRGSLDGALEAYSFATFAQNELPGSIAHELSHTWWGGIVPCAYTSSMWNEAFATYSDALFCRQRLSEDGQSAYDDGSRPHDYEHRFDSLPLAQAHDTSNRRQTYIGYDKGARVLRVLEDQIGLDVMLRCMSAFATDHPRGEAADWSEFEQVVGRVTGQDYAWFWDEWLQRPGLPTLRLSGVTTRHDASGYQVECDIVQSSPAYRLRIPVRVQTRDGASVVHVVEAEGLSTHLSLQIPSAPAHLALDPDEILPLSAHSVDYDFPADAQ